jgi:hypothetical protein
MARQSEKLNAKDVKNNRQRQGFKERIWFGKLLCDLSFTLFALRSCEVYEEFEHGRELISDTPYRYNNLKYDIAGYNRLEEVCGY